MGELIAGVRPADTLGPTPGASTMQCFECREAVLLSPTSMTMLETNPEALVVCNRCLPKIAGEAELSVGTTPLHEAELKRLIETTPEDRLCQHGLAWCPSCDGFPKRG